MDDGAQALKKPVDDWLFQCLVCFFIQNKRSVLTIFRSIAINKIANKASRKHFFSLLGTVHIRESLGQISGLNKLWHPIALLDRIGGMCHVQRMH